MLFNLWAVISAVNGFLKDVTWFDLKIFTWWCICLSVSTKEETLSCFSSFVSHTQIQFLEFRDLWFQDSLWVALNICLKLLLMNPVPNCRIHYLINDDTWFFYDSTLATFNIRKYIVSILVILSVVLNTYLVSNQNHILWYHPSLGLDCMPELYISVGNCMMALIGTASVFCKCCIAVTVGVFQSITFMRI